MPRCPTDSFGVDETPPLNHQDRPLDDHSPQQRGVPTLLPGNPGTFRNPTGHSRHLGDVTLSLRKGEALRARKLACTFRHVAISDAGDSKR
ncbi:hypothetical protein OPV22_022416 [Ensete ventricosum]|uniref:Uncharacterized protein n=1 Tax=Ensete ventricosum TaxID=4639 RepID=A0AAV8QUA5_ENSVE|nr:hypothetical protein OPV22_022416 [Ensete ventricosum]